MVKTNDNEPESTEHKINKNSKNSFVSWSVFSFSLAIVLISLVSVIFPTLIASSSSTVKELETVGIDIFEIDPFQTGIWAQAAIITNVLVFLLALIYFKKKVPLKIKSLIDFIFNFEVSKKVAIISIIVLLGVYIGLSAGELTTEEHWEDYAGVKNRVENWSPGQAASSFEPHVKYLLHWISMELFGYYTVVPFLASISLLIMTFLFTVQITKKRFAGIVAFVILLQSNVFLTYDTTVSYTNFWALFYLLSLYLVYKLWPLSPVSYLLSIGSKALTTMFFPMSLYFILRCNISKTRKILVSVSTASIIIAGLAIVSSGTSLGGITGQQEEFYLDEFWMGFASFSYQLRFDGLIQVFILPLIVGLFIAFRHRIYHADSILVFIGGLLLVGPLLTGFTELTNQPYRFVPLVTFFAIGVGVLLSKKMY